MELQLKCFTRTAYDRANTRAAAEYARRRTREEFFVLMVGTKSLTGAGERLAEQNMELIDSL